MNEQMNKLLLQKHMEGERDSSFDGWGKSFFFKQEACKGVEKTSSTQEASLQGAEKTSRIEGGGKGR